MDTIATSTTPATTTSTAAAAASDRNFEREDGEELASVDGRSRASGAAHESDAEFGEIGADFRRPESGSDGVTTECVGVLVDGLKGGGEAENIQCTQGNRVQKYVKSVISFLPFDARTIKG